jgi:hypothetical protein
VSVWRSLCVSSCSLSACGWHRLGWMRQRRPIARFRIRASVTDLSVGATRSARQIVTARRRSEIKDRELPAEPGCVTTDEDGRASNNAAGERK